MCNRCWNETGAGESNLRKCSSRCICAGGRAVTSRSCDIIETRHGSFLLRGLKTQLIINMSYVVQNATDSKDVFIFHSPIKLSSTTRNGSSASLPLRSAKSLESCFTTSDVCVNLNKPVSKWVTAPPRVSQEETGAAQVRASQDWLCLGHYLEERPLRGLDTVQRSRVLDMRAGNRTAWVPAYQAVNKTRWDTAVEPGAPFPFPHSPALQKQIRRKRKSVQPVFPLPSPRCCCCCRRRCHLPPSLYLPLFLSPSPPLPPPPPPPPPSPPPPPLSHTDSRFTFL